MRNEMYSKQTELRKQSSQALSLAPLACLQFLGRRSKAEKRLLVGGWPRASSQESVSRCASRGFLDNLGELACLKGEKATNILALSAHWKREVSSLFM